MILSIAWRQHQRKIKVPCSFYKRGKIKQITKCFMWSKHGNATLLSELCIVLWITFLFNLYLFSKGSLRAMICFPGTSWSHSQSYTSTPGSGPVLSQYDLLPLPPLPINTNLTYACLFWGKQLKQRTVSGNFNGSNNHKCFLCICLCMCAWPQYDSYYSGCG